MPIPLTLLDLLNLLAEHLVGYPIADCPSAGFGAFSGASNDWVCPEDKRKKTELNGASVLAGVSQTDRSWKGCQARVCADREFSSFNH